MWVYQVSENLCYFLDGETVEKDAIYSLDVGVLAQPVWQLPQTLVVKSFYQHNPLKMRLSCHLKGWEGKRGKRGKRGEEGGRGGRGGKRGEEGGRGGWLEERSNSFGSNVVPRSSISQIFLEVYFTVGNSNP